MVKSVQHYAYEELIVASNETYTVTLGAGEAVTNKLIDITAPGATVQFDATGVSNWRLENIGIKGTHPGDGPPLAVNVPSSTETGVVRHIYWGDGFATDNAAALTVADNHRGDLRFERLHVAHSSTDALHATKPGEQGHEGHVEVHDSYFYSNNTSNVRIGGPGSTHRVANTTIHCDNTTPGSAPATRGVWAYHGPVDVVDSHINTTDEGADLVEHTASGGSITTTNTTTGSAASTTPPGGVPTTPEEAASGDTGGAGTIPSPDSAWRIEWSGGVETIPLYDPADISPAGVRMGLPTGTGDTGAASARIASADSDPAHALRIQTPSGTRAVETVGRTMLEDFEDGVWPDNWSNETTAYQLTTTALQGTYSLEHTGSFGNVGNGTISTPRGWRYACWTVATGSDPQPGLLVNVQDPARAQTDNYGLWLDVAGDRLRLVKRVGGGTTILQDVSVSLTTGTSYRLVLDVTSDTVTGRVATDAGELAATSAITDTSHAGGYLGIYTGGSDSVGTRYDEFTKGPIP